MLSHDCSDGMKEPPFASPTGNTLAPIGETVSTARGGFKSPTFDKSQLGSKLEQPHAIDAGSTP